MTEEQLLEFERWAVAVGELRSQLDPLSQAVVANDLKTQNFTALTKYLFQHASSHIRYGVPLDVDPVRVVFLRQSRKTIEN